MQGSNKPGCFDNIEIVERDWNCWKYCGFGLITLLLFTLQIVDVIQNIVTISRHMYIVMIMSSHKHVPPLLALCEKNPKATGGFL